MMQDGGDREPLPQWPEGCYSRRIPGEAVCSRFEHGRHGGSDGAEVTDEPSIEVSEP